VAKKKKYMVVPRNQRVAEQGLVTSKGRLKFKGKSAMFVNDEALAREIDTQHGLKGNRDVYLHEDDRAATYERDEGGSVHHYFWGSSRRYAAAYDRIFRKEVE